MPTTKQLQERKTMEGNLRRRGIAAELSMTPAPRAQWYRGDGVPLPNLLPADPYHMSLYHDKGWSMIPPDNIQPAEAWKPTAQMEADNTSQHIHRFGKKSGSECRHDGCTEIRKMPFKSRG